MEYSDLILEIKKSSIRPNNKQIKKYHEITDCPVVYICGMEEAKDIVKTAKFYLAIEGHDV